MLKCIIFSTTSSAPEKICVGIIPLSVDLSKRPELCATPSRVVQCQTAILAHGKLWIRMQERKFLNDGSTQ